MSASVQWIEANQSGACVAPQSSSTCAATTVNSSASSRTFLHQHSVRHASTAKASFLKHYDTTNATQNERRLRLQCINEACPSCDEAAKMRRTSCTRRVTQALRSVAEASSPPSEVTPSQVTPSQVTPRQVSSKPGHPQGKSRPSQVTGVPKRTRSGPQERGSGLFQMESQFIWGGG